MIEPRYRKDYTGEFVIVESRWTGGKKEQVREWVANPIENHHLSGRAACIGSELDRSRFDFSRLQNHRGGLLGSKKLQTYGTGKIASHMRLDFAIELQPNELQRIKESKYQETNIVYTTSRLCIQNTGEFYLIPYNPVICQEALLPYLAAFDGHKEIFLLGYNQDTPAGNSAWIEQTAKVFNAYSLTQFNLVGVKNSMPNKWLTNTNVRVIDYDYFITYCDV